MFGGTYKYRAEIDVDRVIEITLDDTYEDACFDSGGVKELQIFIDDWNKKYGFDYYYESNVLVMVPEEMMK